MDYLPHLRATGWFGLAAGIAGLAIVALFIATPTPNMDDLGYMGLWLHRFTEPQFWKVLGTVLLNADLGITEMRTYGLSRAIQVVTMAVFGKAPAGTYLTMVALHFASAFAVFALMRQISGDRIIALFAAAVWAASPVVLPFFKSQHHYLYSVAAFYPLLWWIVVSAKISHDFNEGMARKWVGIFLLLATCLMGESAIIPMGAAVLATAWARRNRQLLYQGLGAFALLGAYVLYEKVFINDATHAQRFTLLAVNPAYVKAALAQTIENGKAFLSYSYYAAEFAGRVGGVNAFKTPLTALTFVLVGGAAVYTALRASRLSDGVDRRLALVLPVVCLASLILHLAVISITGLPLAMRYTAAFYALLPLAVLSVLLAVFAGPMVRVPAVLTALRIGTGALAAFALAVSLGTLYRTEVLVNQPARAFIAELKPQTAFVLHHAEWPVTSPDGNILGSYPGFVSLYQYEAGNPFRAAWTTNLYFFVYKNIMLGTRCEIAPDGNVAVFYGNQARGTFAPDAVRGGGLTSFWSTEFRWQPLSELCTPAAISGAAQ